MADLSGIIRMHEKGLLDDQAVAALIEHLGLVKGSRSRLIHDAAKMVVQGRLDFSSLLTLVDAFLPDDNPNK